MPSACFPMAEDYDDPDDPLDRAPPARDPAARRLPRPAQPAQGDAARRLRDPGRHRLRERHPCLCRADARPGRRPGSTRQLIGLYIELHRRGHAHSVEIWRDGQLVGGLYGLRAGRRLLRREHVLARAAMPARSPWSIWSTRLRAGGFVLLDAQFVTDHLQRFGAVEISRADLSAPAAPGPAGRRRLPDASLAVLPAPARARRGRRRRPAAGSGSSGSAQPTTQTS